VIALIAAGSAFVLTGGFAVLGIATSTIHYAPFTGNFGLLSFSADARF